MNKVLLTGYIGKDFELQGTTSGKSYIKTSLGVKDRFNKDHTNWINLVAWNKQAETMAKWLAKGSHIAVEGRIQTGSYERDGRKVYTTDVIVDNFDFLESRNSRSEKANNYNLSENTTSSVQAYAYEQPEQIEIDDRDLPF